MLFNNHKALFIRSALILTLLGGIFTVQPAYAGTVGFGWVQGGGGMNLDYATAIAEDDSGNVYATGFVTNGPGNEDAFLNKWDTNGNPIWARFVAGAAHDANHGVALDGAGNVYVAGAYSDMVEFDPGNSAGDLTSEGLTDIFVIKYDPDGSVIWVKGVGGTSSDGGYGITADESGNVYVTGIYVDTVDFDPGGGVSTLTSAGFADVFILKLESDGNFLWAKSMGGPGSDYSFDVAVDGNGNVFTTGYFNDTADFDPGAGTSNLTSLGLSDIFISKLDSSGNFVWARRAGGASSDVGVEITLDESGNAYSAANFYGLVSGANNDILISKLDPDGNWLWTKGTGGTSFDASYGIALDEAGNVYITGEFADTVDFDPGQGTSSLTSAGASDVFISKLDNEGNFLWAKNLGGTSSDLGEGIVVQNDGSLLLTGAFSDTVDFDLGAGTSTLTSAGGLDVFITKLPLNPQIYYVNWDATGADDGTSWEDAYTDLQSALSAASYGDEIWVAAGTYKPTSGTDRAVSFTLKNGVAVYGGFSGTETSRAQRNYETNVTVLSGDIGAQGHNSDNSYHVVVGSDTNNSAILDGFTITGGNANGDAADSAGGGMYTLTGSPTVSNITFIDNFGAFGGGMFNSGLESNPPDLDTPGSHPLLTNVIFENNAAVAGGGGMRNMNFSNPILTNVIFRNNTVTRTGGGMENFNYSSPVLTNVTFAGNTAAAGGGMYNWVGNNPILTGVIFTDNSAEDGGGMGNYESNPSLTNVIFSGNSATSRGGGILNESYSHPSIKNAIFSNNTAFNGGGIYNISNGIGGTATLTDATLTGNSAYVGGAVYNLGGSPTFTRVTFHDNSAPSGNGGGMYNTGSNAVLINVTLSGNTAERGGGMYNTSSRPALTNVTFGGNLADENGGGMFNYSNSRPALTNVILWGNGTEIYNDYSTPAIQHSIVQGSGGSGGLWNLGLGTDGGGNLDTDPLLEPLTDNGGFIQTMALGAGSPAIDAGDDASCPDTDQRRVTRPQGAGCDIGAYEAQLLNSAPTGISLSPSSVNENQPVGTTVGVLSTIDPDANDSHTYSFCGGANDASFSISGNQLKTAAVFDYETKASYSVCVRSTDSGNLSTTKTFVVGVNNLIDAQTFGDVSSDYWAQSFIERLYLAGITGGCAANPPMYCPEATVTRAQMAVFLERGIHGSSYNPPAVGAGSGFSDVPINYWAAVWIKQLAADGITGGCGAGLYCPEAPVTRAQMAVFLLRAKYGASYNPPVVGVTTGFGDVPPHHWAAAWIKQLVNEGITAGCGNGNYCPDAPVTRAQMAVFLVRIFNLP